MRVRFVRRGQQSLSPRIIRKVRTNGPRGSFQPNDMLRELRRRKKPFTCTISKEGRVSQVRLYERGEWKTIIIGRRNPPHVNIQKADEPGTP